MVFAAHSPSKYGTDESVFCLLDVLLHNTTHYLEQKLQLAPPVECCCYIKKGKECFIERPSTIIPPTVAVLYICMPATEISIRIWASISYGYGLASSRPSCAPLCHWPMMNRMFYSSLAHDESHILSLMRLFYCCVCHPCTALSVNWICSRCKCEQQQSP